MVRLTRAEQETIIRWGEADEQATIYSDSPVVQRRMRASGWPTEGDGTGLGSRTWLVPVGAVRFPPTKDGYEKQKSQPGNAEAMRKAREARDAARLAVKDPPTGDS